jgi:hypothetical protein
LTGAPPPVAFHTAGPPGVHQGRVRLDLLLAQSALRRVHLVEAPIHRSQHRVALPLHSRIGGFGSIRSPPDFFSAPGYR